MMNYEVLERLPGQVVEHVVFELRDRDVVLAQLSGAYGHDTTWVAVSDSGLRHNPDPEIALGRFVSEERAQRLVGAYSAFKQEETTQSEETQIEVK